MFTRIKDRNIWLIYLAIFLLGIAYGIALALSAIYLDALHYSKSDIGTLAAWFALGIVTFSLPMGPLIRRFSARRTLIASLFGYAITVAAFPFLPSYSAIAFARFFDGAFSVGIWVSCETILLARSDRENKAFVTSLYAISMAIGYVLGPLSAGVIIRYFPERVAFIISGIIATISSIVVLLRLDADVPEDVAESGIDGTPAAPPGPRLSAGELLWRIKTSCFATFAYGYFQASVVLFLPLFLIEHKGVPRDKTIYMTAAFAAGMLLFSNYAGRLGDRYGHLGVMRVLAVIGTTMVCGFVYLDSFTLMCIATGLAGATLASISPVSLALQGVIAERRDYSRSNATYNVFYAAGMLLGPPISSVLYLKGGGPVMLYHLAALWTAFIVFSIFFYRDDPAVARSVPVLVPGATAQSAGAGTIER